MGTTVADADWMAEDFYSQRGEFPHLEGLRGIAVLLVVLHHLRPELPESSLVANGRFGVSIFFVLSGFLITSLLLRELRERGRVDAQSFVVRRIARIAPAYAAVLGAYVAAVIAFGLFSPSHQDLFVDKLPSLVTFTSNWGASPTEGPFFVAWSLAAEMQFYLAIVVVVAVFGTRGALAMAGVLVSARLVQASLLETGASVWWLRGVEESIWIGVLGAVLLARPGFRRWVDMRVSVSIVVALLLLLLTLLSVDVIPHKHGLTAFGIALLSAVCIVLATRCQRVPLLGSRFLEYLGSRSYGIYLTHMMVILLARRVLGGPWTVLLSLPLALALAEVLLRLVERPGGAWLRERLMKLKVRTLQLGQDARETGA
jgi:peptidoglycan/LPS O-acetylase OafA/YrhL